MESALLLNVVVREGTSILQLLSGEDQALLIRRNSFLVLDLGLDVFNSVRGFNFEGDGLSSEGLDENLHSTTESEHQVKGRLLLDIVIGESASILKLFS